MKNGEFNDVRLTNDELRAQAHSCQQEANRYLSTLNDGRPLSLVALEITYWLTAKKDYRDLLRSREDDEDNFFQNSVDKSMTYWKEQELFLRGISKNQQ